MKPKVTLSDIDYNNREILTALAFLSHRASQKNSSNWLPTVDAAMQELLNASKAGTVTKMVADTGIPRGWIAARSLGHGSWEIHPLLVDPDVSGRGYGRILVEDVVQQMRSNGGVSVFLSTSDAKHSTNLSDFDLYENAPEAIRNLRVRDNTLGHAYQFWQRVGFTVVGIIPDAEGLGVPSIYLSKKL